jgi:hypothetical protein
MEKKETVIIPYNSQNAKNYKIQSNVASYLCTVRRELLLFKEEHKRASNCPKARA